jgi:hypothetical protein
MEHFPSKSLSSEEDRRGGGIMKKMVEFETFDAQWMEKWDTSHEIRKG